MGNPLFERRLPSEWSGVGQVIEFKEKLGSFERLSMAVADDLATLDPDEVPADWRETVVEGQLKFDYALAGSELPTVSGTAKVDVDAVCQRSLNPFRLRVETEFQLILVGEDQSQEDREGFEIWEFEGSAIKPVELIDELLVMSLPLSALQELESGSSGSVDDDIEPAQDMVRPFAALREQMDEEN